MVPSVSLGVLATTVCRISRNRFAISCGEMFVEWGGNNR